MQSTPSILHITQNHKALTALADSANAQFAIVTVEDDPNAIMVAAADSIPDVLAIAISNTEQWQEQLAVIAQNSSLLIIKQNPDINDAELYRLGADIVFSEDVHPESLQAWLTRKLQQIEARKQLQMDAQSAAQTANIAMTNSSELGRVIHFVESTFDLHSSQGLALGIFQLLQTIGLKSSIDFRWSGGDEDTFNCDGGSVGDAEKLILQEFYNDGRIIDFGCRTLVNYPKVSLLVKNMPVDDEESYGRIKDLLPIILGSVNEKLEMLDQERTMYANSCETVEVFQQFKNSTFKLAKIQNDNNTRDMKELSEMTQGIFERLPGLGLDEDQESYIEKSLQGALDKIAVSFQDSAKNTADFLTMVEEIKDLNERLELIADTFAPRDDVVEEEPEIQQDDTEYDFEDDDIILF